LEYNEDTFQAIKEIYDEGQAKHGDQVTRYKNTDAGNAERFADALKGQYLYIPEQKAWYRYNGKFWEEDIDNRITQDVIRSLRKSQAEVLNIADDDRREKTIKWLLSSESQTKIASALNLMSSIPFMSARTNRFDCDDMLLNAQNGTVDLRTGQLRKHNKEDYLSKICNIGYKPNSKSVLFDSFLEDITEGNQDKKLYIQKLCGYCCTAKISDEEFYQARGSGQNGKTKIFETVKYCLGSYAVTASPDILMQRDMTSIPNDIARLQSARLVLLSEPDPGKRFSDNAIKTLTGGDTIIARYLHKEFFEFTMKAKMILLTNHEIRAVGTDHGLWRRIVVIPFTYQVPEYKKDKHLQEKLIAEAEAVLSWMVEGCLLWQREGLRQPQELEQVKNEYRIGQDAIGLFLDECCTEEAKGKVKASELHSVYKQWCVDSGEYPLSQRELGKRLREKGYTSFKSNVVYWGGLILGVGSNRELNQINQSIKNIYKDLPENAPALSQVPNNKKPWYEDDARAGEPF
jgi:putative DNA primase/helicase